MQESKSESKREQEKASKGERKRTGGRAHSNLRANLLCTNLKPMGDMRYESSGFLPPTAEKPNRQQKTWGSMN